MLDLLHDQFLSRAVAVQNPILNSRKILVQTAGFLWLQIWPHLVGVGHQVLVCGILGERVNFPPHLFKRNRLASAAFRPHGIWDLL